jgi:hypothetical protein
MVQSGNLSPTRVYTNYIPHFSTFFLEFVIDDVVSLKQLHLDKDLSCEIRYADDTTLLSVIFEKLPLLTNELEKACTIWD